MLESCQTCMKIHSNVQDWILVPFSLWIRPAISMSKRTDTDLFSCFPSLVCPQPLPTQVSAGITRSQRTNPAPRLKRSLFLPAQWTLQTGHLRAFSSQDDSPLMVSLNRCHAEGKVELLTRQRCGWDAISKPTWGHLDYSRTPDCIRHRPDRHKKTQMCLRHCKGPCTDLHYFSWRLCHSNTSLHSKM